MKRILARRNRASSSTRREGSGLPVQGTTEQGAFGLKVLVEGVDPNVDIIAIHGLNGHREKTWTAKNGTLWLQDLLSKFLPSARIITYGYDSRTHSTDPLSHQTLYGHALTLVSTLTLFIQVSKTSCRPIIFIVHSLGGIVLKSALIHSDSCRMGHLEHHKALKLSTYGILFFGTPHQGGNGVPLGELVLRIASVVLNTNDRAMKHLEQHSEWLETQLGQYSAISQDFDTTFLYESYPTPLPLGSTIIVPKASATVLGTRNAESIEVRKNHHTMVKFEGATDADFQVVSSRLVSMNQRAERRVTENWVKWTKTEEKRK